MKIIIFGTGSAADKALGQINDSIEILAVTDNDVNKWGKIWNCYNILNPSEIYQYKYDYILICSMYTNEIIESLIQKGVKRDKIIPYFNNINWEEQAKKEKGIRKLVLRQNNSKKIALLTRRNSGCNSRALYNNIPKNIKENFDVSLIDYDDYKKNWDDFEILFTTNMEGRIYKNRINIESWHGFPIKSLGVFEKNCTDNLVNANNGIDYIISYSNFYSFIMSSVFRIDIDKFTSTGMPRNDFLVNREAKKLISQIIKRETKNKRIVYYVPTFRRRIDKQLREGIEVISQTLDLEMIDKYMEDSNSYFIVKKHPVEGDSFIENRFRNVFFLTDDVLRKMDIDFYEILGESDLLITDYSSIYFDYLLLNKPIIFWTKDQEMYEEKRGFLFEHTDSMMPGPNVKTIDELIDALKKFTHDSNWYSTERINLKKLVHAYDDFNSSERVWNTLLSIYDKKR